MLQSTLSPLYVQAQTKKEQSFNDQSLDKTKSAKRNPT